MRAGQHSRQGGGRSKQARLALARVPDTPHSFSRKRLLALPVLHPAYLPQDSDNTFPDLSPTAARSSSLPSSASATNRQQPHQHQKA